MKRNMKPDQGRLIRGLAPLKLNAVDLGALQSELVLASRDAKAKTKALRSAEDAHDAASNRFATARDNLAAASRAVMANA